jgi:hypothetical protein
MMHNRDADLDRIVRISRVLTISFWCGVLIASLMIAFALFVWMPKHPVG